MEHPPIRGRGSASNPANRFLPLAFLPDAAARDPDDPGPRTHFMRDGSRSALTTNKSPDIGFTHGLNPYRGCEHGCSYCYARPTHEYLGFSAGLDFETRILVKQDLPELLQKELSSPRWKPTTVMMSGVTDCYQPAERRLRVTRRCLEVLARFRNPVGIITKNHLVTRDLDLLGELASFDAVSVNLSITSLDPRLQRVMEPRTATPERRLDAVRQLARAGIPVGVMVAPVVPGLTDHEMPRILEAAAAAGATWAGMVPLRLPLAVAPLFEQWLEAHFPDRRERVLNRVREMRGGRLNDARFGSRMRGEGTYAEQMNAIFTTYKRRYGLDAERPTLSTGSFRRPEAHGQTELFGG